MLKSLFSGITQLSLRFKWITIAIVVAFLGLGVMAISQMNQELLPSIEFPQTFILALQPGMSSEDLRDLVTIPLEQAVSRIDGIIPAGLESTTTSPIAFLTIRNETRISQATMRKQIQAAIDTVIAGGVPAGLKTTADLTPEIMTTVLTRAPSMWKHFEGQHLLAMSPAVLDAALAVNPAFADQIDPLTRDQLAARRLDSTLSGSTQDVKPVALPGAWIMTDDKKPQIRDFSLADIPVISASVFSTSNMTPQQLADFINNEMVPAIKKVPGVADVQISGGQQIPKEVADAAKAAVEKANAEAAAQANGTNANAAQATPAPTATAQATAKATAQSTPVPSTQPQVDPNGVPLLPPSWNAALGMLLNAQFRTADDLFAVKDGGQTLTAAALINKVVDQKFGNFVGELSPAVITYVIQKEPGFLANLSPAALGALSAEAYATAKGEKVAPALLDPWPQLAQQPGFKQAGLATVRDLMKFDGGAAATLNAIVKDTPANLQGFAIRLINALTPDAFDYLNTYEKGFFANLDPQVWRYMSSDALKARPVADYVATLPDAQLKADLQAIANDPGKAAVASLQSQTSTADTLPDDPNAPALPADWNKQLSSFVNNPLKKADDLLRHPASAKTAAAFLNLLAANANAGPFIKELTPDILLYLQAHEATFFTELGAGVLALLPKETLSKLPKDVQDRALSGPSFTPATTITRTNSKDSLTLAILKSRDSNTVVVSDGVDKVFQDFQAKDSTLQIATVFEQASFIKESISGVAREGGLGAVMAVLVILLFLNFSFRSTLVTAVSIPTSVAIAFVLMRWLPGTAHNFLIALPEGPVLTFLLRLFPGDLTLNIMTLSGLTVAIGRVVDDSIVVLENIYREIQKGEVKNAVVKATRDVSVAIFAATATTVVVFLPIGLTGGIIGEFFLPFGLAVTYSLIASFIVAITIVPVLAFLFISKQNVPEEKEGGLERAYHGTIRWALGHRLVVLIGAAITLAIGLFLFTTRPTTFLPSFGEPQITVSISLPSGTPIEQTDVRVRRFEDYLATLSAKGVSKYQVVIGSAGGLASFIGGSSGVTGSDAQVTIAAKAGNADALTALTAEIRAKAESIFISPKFAKVSKASLSEQGFGGFAVVLSGPQEDLLKVNPDVIKTLSTVKGLTNVTSTLNLVEGATSTTYLRIGQTAAVQYSGELETQDTLGVTQLALDAVQKMPNLPNTITVGQGFQSQQQTEGFAQMFGSLAIAIIIVYAVMVITFGSFVQPFTILFSLPLAVVGAALGLTVTNRVLGISALIGMLMLVGIVVTNAIVLIDRVQANRKERGMTAREALVEGGRTRLRPILMTAIATMIALLPLASGLSISLIPPGITPSQGAIIASELGTVVIGGLFSSTFLTLLVVPVIYSLIDQLQGIVLRRPSQAAEKEGRKIPTSASAD